MSSNSGVDYNSDRRQFGSGSREISMSRKVCTSYEQNIDDVAIICANCGKGEEGGINLKSCTACMMVKYCSRDCQAAHRLQHKKECKRRAAELHEEALFKEAEREDCPLCMLPLPLTANEIQFQSCCGKVICHGCIHAMILSEGGADLCPFCREHMPTEEEYVERTKKLKDSGSAEAFCTLGDMYARGTYGMPQDWNKANELWLKGGELGCAEAYSNLGVSYHEGRGVAIDKKKAKHYLELSVINGEVCSRYNLAILEGTAGNFRRANKHFIIAARAGDKGSLDVVKNGFKKGVYTKDEYADTLRAYQQRLDEMKSEEREMAAAMGMGRAY